MIIVLEEHEEAWKELQLMLKDIAESGGSINTHVREITKLRERTQGNHNIPDGSCGGWFKRIRAGLKLENEVRKPAFAEALEAAKEAFTRATEKAVAFHSENDAILSSRDILNATWTAARRELEAMQDEVTAAERIYQSLREKQDTFCNLVGEFPYVFDAFTRWDAQPPRPVQIVKNRIVPSFENLPIFWVIQHLSGRLVGDRHGGNLGPLSFMSLELAENYANKLDGDRYIAFQTVLNALTLVEFTIESQRPAYRDVRQDVPTKGGMFLFDREEFAKFSPELKNAKAQEKWHDAVMSAKINQLITANERQ